MDDRSSSPNGEPAPGPLAAYRERVAAGGLKHDPAQALAAEKLEGLHRALSNYRPAGNASGWRARLGLAGRTGPAPHGLYLFGGVGRGKSMLMDLFFSLAPVEHKRRVHFHEFMIEVHARIHEWRQLPADKRGRDPIAPLANQLAAEAWLLCFDEFQVTNIADATILGRLFTALFARGVVVVATSNTAPDDLYADGLQRELFLPAIALLTDRLDLLELDGDVDYRRTRLGGMPVWYAPLGPESSDALDAMFTHIAGGESGAMERLIVQGRELVVNRAANGVAMATFAELCERPLGAADYLTLATHFHTLVLDGVRQMTEDERDVPRRFVTLIDEVYEHRVKLICAAAAAPDQLYPAGQHAAEFRRTVSRLHEMQSDEYLASPHLT
ncbi:MAG: cell division protein ZapE [Rhodospirillales bacterium]|nr:cell division protein ZapE [Rhodospirillales bacterium]